MPFKYNALLGLGLDNTIPLDGAGKIPSTFLPSYVDDVEEYNNLAAFPATGETGKIYVAIDTGFVYRWSGSVYVQIGITAAAGSTTQVQFNDAGAFGGDSGLTFNKTTDALSAGGFIPTSSTVPANGIYLPAANSVAVATNGVQRINIEADGDINIDGGGVFYDATNNRLGIGTTGPGEKLDVSSGTSGTAAVVKIQDPAGRVLQIASPGASTEAYIGTTTNHKLDFYTNNGVKATLDASGRLLVGTSTSTGAYYNAEGNWQGIFQVARSDVNAVASFSIWNATASTYTNFGGAQLHFSACKSGTVGSHTSGALASGDTVGSITFSPSDGTNFRNCARIEAVVDGGVSTNDVPGRLVFSTTADGAVSPTERMRITSTGRIGSVRNPDATWPVAASVSGENGAILLPNGSVSTSTNGDTCYYANRNNADGDLIRFFESGTLEGAISVSGTTVTYGGGHLARWSQLPSNEDPSEIFKGTVMSNLDEMCDWGEEDNEQLNKTKISDIEGDKNVAGVFVSTSFSDDGPLDFFVAMTGDMVIRIAEGVTVERGDLLMSAGDGTAKPQDDDIIRSKTIAKVTSTNVSCTYPDGSYCVPCVLMAC